MAFSIILVLEKCNLGPWKSLKSAWILYLEFAMNPVSRFVCRRLLVFCSKTNNTCLTVCFFSGQPEQTGTRKIELFFISVRQVRIWGFAVKLFFNYKFRKNRLTLNASGHSIVLALRWQKGIPPVKTSVGSDAGTIFWLVGQSGRQWGLTWIVEVDQAADCRCPAVQEPKFVITLKIILGSYNSENNYTFHCHCHLNECHCNKFFYISVTILKTMMVWQNEWFTLPIWQWV